MILAILFLISPVCAQSVPSTTSDPSHYPRLIRAELPLYPPLAWTAHVTGTIQVEITVQSGKVVDAQVKSSTTRNPQLAMRTLENAKTWEFEPQGNATFLVTYTYAIEGEQTPLPENPRVELDLPHSVKIIAKPFKPTVTSFPSGTPVP
jgi:TonB family protein